jgi:hypothetical protein
MTDMQPITLSLVPSSKTLSLRLEHTPNSKAGNPLHVVETHWGSLRIR